MAKFNKAQAAQRYMLETVINAAAQDGFTAKHFGVVIHNTFYHGGSFEDFKYTHNDTALEVTHLGIDLMRTGIGITGENPKNIKTQLRQLEIIKKALEQKMTEVKDLL